MGYRGGTNLLDYVRNNPSGSLDPVGLLELGRPGDYRWPEFPEDGLPYKDWFNWWWPHVGYGWGNKEEFEEGLRKGCIGVCGTFCGYSDIDEFRKALTHCYKSQTRAQEVAKKTDCGEGGSCYGGCRVANVVAVQFSAWLWVPGKGRGNAQKNWDALPPDQPIAIGSPGIWPIVYGGIDENGKPVEGAFDFQICVPDRNCWIGANCGVTEGGPPMKVCSCDSKGQAERIKEGDRRGHTLHVWCVVCDKKQEEGRR